MLGVALGSIAMIAVGLAKDLLLDASTTERSSGSAHAQPALFEGQESDEAAPRAARKATLPTSEIVGPCSPADGTGLSAAPVETCAPEQTHVTEAERGLGWHTTGFVAGRTADQTHT